MFCYILMIFKSVLKQDVTYEKYHCPSQSMEEAESIQ